ncbi:MAG: MFS transporter, partial [Candidatus Methanomethylicus sp.]|nr:MFS transporter [Candidatus Methanomethylicus sp.]
MTSITSNAVKPSIPPAIKRNTIMLTVTQALFSGVFQSAMVIAALGVFFFTQSATLGSLASAVAIGGRVLVAYGAGRLMDRVGRKTVLYAGIVVTCTALLVMAYALQSSLSWLFWLGIFAFGTGAGVMNLLRVPVTDMYPASRRGEGMGFLLTGSVVGTFMAPLLSAFAPYLTFIGLGTYVLILLTCIPVMALGTLFVKLISPDTREILKNL